MTKVYCIGETVYDIIFERGQPKAARAGGSMLNSAVSLGRSGLKVEMITELGDDRVGEMVMDFLEANGVSVALVRPVKGFKTPVSLAFLDEQGNAQYSFYKNYPEERLHISWPKPSSADIVLFGSFYSVDPAVHWKIAAFVRSAKESGALIIYDPNIRKNHLKEIQKLMENVKENIALAGIIRGSDEDFANLFGLKDGGEIYQRILDLGGQSLIITRGSEGADLYAGDIRLNHPARKVQVISTIGAGDSFNAGIIFGLVIKGFTGSDLMRIGIQEWKEILGYGIQFASEVCGSFDNYIV
jgi:fructokinase